LCRCRIRGCYPVVARTSISCNLRRCPAQGVAVQSRAFPQSGDASVSPSIARTGSCPDAFAIPSTLRRQAFDFRNLRYSSRALNSGDCGSDDLNLAALIGHVQAGEGSGRSGATPKAFRRDDLGNRTFSQERTYQKICPASELRIAPGHDLQQLGFLAHVDISKYWVIRHN
jgi:hypothetical protein